MQQMAKVAFIVSAASWVHALARFNEGRAFRPRNAPTPMLTSSTTSTTTAKTGSAKPSSSANLSSLPSGIPINLVNDDNVGERPKRKWKGKGAGKTKAVVNGGNGITYVVRKNKSGKHDIKTPELDDDDPKQCPGGGIYPDWSKLEKRMNSEKPVFAPPVASRTVEEHGKPHYVFISGLPYSGTTALYGLISTSPEVSNLCKGKANCCEGLPLLTPSGMISYVSALNPEYPKDWTAAFGVYKQFWNLSKPILVDKSIGNIDRFPKMLQAVQREGARASFIYVVRSKCYYQHPELWNIADELRKVVERGDELRSAGARFLVVKYEDMLANPYKVSKDILDFIPELQSLDPLQNGLKGAPYTDGDNRGQGLATYVKLKRFFVMGRPTLAIPPDEGKWLRKLGYTKKYFSHAPFAQGYFKNGAPLLYPAESEK